MKPSTLGSHAFIAILLAQVLPAKDLEIHAGDRLREQSIVTVESPGDLPPNPVLQAADGKLLPLQPAADGKISFILPSIAANQTLSFKLSNGDRKAPAALATTEGDQIKFTVTDKAVATYQASAKSSPRENLDPLFLRGGYLHPLMTPSGKTVTDDYAINHLHHHGVWMAWTKTEYDDRKPDFWNMGQGKGKVDFVSLEKTWSGPVHAGLVSNHKYTDLTGAAPVDVLNEQWTVRVYAVSNSYNLIDLEAAQNIIGKLSLILPVYHYGGLGLRGLGEWNGAANARFLSSEGITDRVKANAQPARWLYMGGLVDGKPAGITILSHPDNFRAPQPLRVHPEEPFISFAPQVKEAMEIKPGETYRSKYRIVLSDGDPDAKLLESLWQDYAKPVTATWKD